MENYKQESPWDGGGVTTVAGTSGRQESAVEESAVVEGVAPAAGTQAGVTAEQVAEIIVRTLSSLRVYVVESDITESQNSVRAVVEQATF
ncbi:hypothetical protein LJC45_02085 [Alistipes sp. OttesenSCG-928-B03]|nr:hypothetical protein [Alistipes sp. OttesenSCG-928-B03]